MATIAGYTWNVQDHYGLPGGEIGQLTDEERLEIASFMAGSEDVEAGDISFMEISDLPDRFREIITKRLLENIKIQLDPVFLTEVAGVKHQKFSGTAAVGYVDL